MAEDPPTARRHPAFFQIPTNWEELTQEEKDAWALIVALASDWKNDQAQNLGTAPPRYPFPDR